MTALTRLMSSFSPLAWDEDAYVESPPFAAENLAGKVVLVPRDAKMEAALDGLARTLGMKKRRQGRVVYLVSRASAARTILEFDWIVRRHWRSNELSVLWAVIRLGEGRGWLRSGTPLQDVADLAGLGAKECGEAVAKLFHANAESVRGGGLGEYATDKKLVEGVLEKVLVGLPSRTEEAVMKILCSSAGGSVAEIHESIGTQGITAGAVYKVVERLKARGFVYPVRYFRVNERGPMREMLSADCRNCFYGFSNTDMCLRDTLVQLDAILQQDFGKLPTPEERTALFTSMKTIPYSSRMNRRVLASLRLMREIEKVAGEGRVSGILRMIEESYGIALPVKRHPG